MAESTFTPRGRRFQPRPSGKPQGSAVGGGKSPYRLGRDFERSIRGRLERKGYFVMRAHGSKGKIDLLAVKRLTVEVAFDVYDVRHVAATMALGIQCKRRGDIGSAEWNDVVDLCEPFGIVPIVATKTGERTVAFYRLDARRERGRQGRPWTEVDPATGEPLPEQMALA